MSDRAAIVVEALEDAARLHAECVTASVAATAEAARVMLEALDRGGKI